MNSLHVQINRSARQGSHNSGDIWLMAYSRCPDHRDIVGSAEIGHGMYQGLASRPRATSSAKTRSTVSGCGGAQRPSPRCRQPRAASRSWSAPQIQQVMSVSLRHPDRQHRGRAQRQDRRQRVPDPPPAARITGRGEHLQHAAAAHALQASRPGGQDRDRCLRSRWGRQERTTGRLSTQRGHRSGKGSSTNPCPSGAPLLPSPDTPAVINM